MHRSLKLLTLCSLMVSTLALQSCVSTPPHDDFVLKRRIVPGTVIGATTGLAVTAATNGNVPAGMVVGGIIGGAYGHYLDSRKGLTRKLMRDGVQIIHLGDYYTLIMPSDKVFAYGTSDIQDIEYSTLNDIARYVQTFPKSKIDIYAYTDNVGSPEHNMDLSQQQARRILSYFWAHGINHYRMNAIGLGRANDVADNATVTGSHKNRRVEIHLREHV